MPKRDPSGPLRHPVVLAGVVASVGAGTLAAFVPGAGAQQGQLPVPQPDPAAVRDRAHQILARSEYRQAKPSAAQRVLDAITRWIGRRIDDLIPNGSGHSGLRSLLVWLFVLAVVVLLVRAVVTGRLRLPQRRGAAPPAIRVVEHLDADGWRAEAERCETAGEWRGALRARYGELVARLVERGRLRALPGRTAGEYRAALAAAGDPHAGEFARATELFELAWYARVPVAAQDVAELRALAAAVLAEVAA